MTDLERFRWALAIVESNNNPDVHLGDGGRALGRWQCHPDRLFQECHTYNIFPTLGETWDSLVRRILNKIYLAFTSNHKPVDIAMYWHLGHWEGQCVIPNCTYEQNFLNAYKHVKDTYG